MSIARSTCRSDEYGGLSGRTDQTIVNCLLGVGATVGAISTFIHTMLACVSVFMRRKSLTCFGGLALCNHYGVFPLMDYSRANVVDCDNLEGTKEDEREEKNERRKPSVELVREQKLVNNTQPYDNLPNL